MTDVIQFIREFGFPTFVCIWFMFRLEKKVELLLERMHQMIVIWNVMSRTLPGVDDERQLDGEVPLEIGPGTSKPNGGDEQ